jgi:excisionase family DNA binding protein
MTTNQRVADPARVQLLTVEEAAALLRQHPKTVYRRVSAGELPWVNIAPKGKRAKIRFRLSSLEAYLDESENLPSAVRRRAA